MSEYLKKLAKLNIFADKLEKEGLKLSAKVIRNFISDYIKINWKNII